MTDVRQFKVSSGEEIICHVIAWPEDSDEDDNTIVIRYPIQILAAENAMNGMRYYSLKPWMVLTETEDSFISVNYSHIIGETIPGNRLLKHYLDTVKALIEDRKEFDNQSTISEEEIERDMKDFQNRLKENIENLMRQARIDAMNDSDATNILKFPDKNKMH